MVNWHSLWGKQMFQKLVRLIALHVRKARHVGTRGLATASPRHGSAPSKQHSSIFFRPRTGLANLILNGGGGRIPKMIIIFGEILFPCWNLSLLVPCTRLFQWCLSHPCTLVPPGSCLACAPLSPALGQSLNRLCPKMQTDPLPKKCYLHLAFQTLGDRHALNLLYHHTPQGMDITCLTLRLLMSYTLYMELLVKPETVSFYLLHNVSTLNQCREVSCVTFVCKHFAS